MRALVMGGTEFISLHLVRELLSRGHEITVATHRSISFGSGQAILRLKDCYLGAGDLRHDGQAVGF